MHSLQVGCRRLRDLDPGPDRTSDRDHLRHLVRYQAAAGVAVAAHHVEHARRHELADQLRHQQRGVGRGVGRLQHHRVACRQRRRPLPDRHHHRVVPRRHGGADPDRLAPDERREAGHVLARRPALEHSRGASKEPDLIHHRRDFLRGGQRERLAGVLRLGLDELIGPGLQRVRDAQQCQAALGRGRVTPAREGFSRRGKGGVHFGLAGDRRGREDLARARVDQIGPSVIAQVRPLAADEVLKIISHGDSVPVL